MISDPSSVGDLFFSKHTTFNSAFLSCYSSKYFLRLRFNLPYACLVVVFVFLETKLTFLVAKCLLSRATGNSDSMNWIPYYRNSITSEN